jgi:hypothetical protein
MSSSRLQIAAAWALILCGVAMGPGPTGPGIAVAQIQADADADQVPDRCDNCRLLVDRGQRDTDGDGFGDLCDCDFDNDGVCNIGDFNLFLPDFSTGVPTAAWRDMNGDGVVNIADFNLFLPGFSTGAPGPAASEPDAAPVDGSCDEAAQGCADPYEQGPCWDTRIPAFPDGAARPWKVHPGSDGCSLDPQVLIDAGFPAAAVNANNPTEAWIADQSLGAKHCPNAAFATFPAGATCAQGVGCDPSDYGKACGQDEHDGSFVECGDVDFPRACELLDVCTAQCGYRQFDCAQQYRKNLVATCDALQGAERQDCRDACLVFAGIYADAVDDQPDPGPDVWTAADRAKEQAACACCPGPGPGGGPPAVCGDGACEATESCHPSSCPEDCGQCLLGASCLTDGDCAVGGCSFRGLCEPLAAGAQCSQNADCTSGSCAGELCAATCGDGACDGAETCGLSDANACPTDCGACPTGSSCSDGMDCASGTCTGEVCVGLAALAACSKSGECGSGICDLGSCAFAPKAPGQSCYDDRACRGEFEGITLGGRCRDFFDPGLGSDAHCVGDGDCPFGEVCRSGGGICDLGLCTDAPKPPGEACGRDVACEPKLLPYDDALFDPPVVAVCNLGQCLGEKVPVGGACDRDFACANAVSGGQGLNRFGLCNLGECIGERLPLGAPCDNPRACDGDGFCADGLCKARALVDCTGNEDCASGLCDLGALGGPKCASECGDGFCDLEGAEVCGPDDLLTCHSDCGGCSLFEIGLMAGGLCVENAHCPTGICNFGKCLAAPNGPGSLCTTDAACWNGICNFGFCVEEQIGIGGVCSTNNICISGACNFGLCVAARSLGDNHPCTTGEACVGGVCNFGLCRDLVPLDGLCSANENCASGACNLGVCVSPGAVGNQLPCTSDAACATGFCADLVISPGVIPLPGTCQPRCGDGMCQFPEVCGFTNVIARCSLDCGQCAAGAPCLSHVDCASGICNFGLCSDGGLANGGVCSANSACASGVCNFGLCIPGELASGSPCTTDAACRNGNCIAGLCIQQCGDGFCDGSEFCGDSNAGLQCTTDCGLCGNGTPCLANDVCASGICNFGFCSAGELAAGAPCTTDLACRSGICAGVCIQDCGDGFCDGTELCGDSNAGLQCTTDCGKCANGTVCATNSVCASGVCNFGFCHPGGLSNGNACSTNPACASGACNFGFCVANSSLGAGSPCTTGLACASGNCTAGLCIQRCGDDRCDGTELCGDSNAGLQCTTDCGKCGNGTPCASNSVCASNACNFGFCVGAGSVGVGGACTTANACSNGICQVGCCGRPATAACTSDSQCCSGDCVTDILGNRSCSIF